MNQEAVTAPTMHSSTQRDYLFDNLRAIFIILVVWAHILDPMTKESDIIKSIYYFIFLFHMAAMTFISGYFSKNLEKIRRNAFVTLLLPYLILNFVDYMYKMFILKQDFAGFRFFRPCWGLWYLLALFFWKLVLKDLVRIRFLLPFSFAFALLSGFSKEFSEYMALGRIFSFLPFFLLGYYCTKDHINKIRKFPKLLSIGLLIAAAGLASYIAVKGIFKKEVLFMRKPYPEDTEIKNMLFRIVIYIFAILVTTAIINLVSSKKSFLTKIGASTMTVYILHVFTIPALEKFDLFKGKPDQFLIYSIVATVLIVFIFSRPFIKRIYDMMMDRMIGLILKYKS